jgi:hypothetical protein
MIKTRHWWIAAGKLKVKLALEQAMKAQKGRRIIALLLL